MRPKAALTLLSRAHCLYNLNRNLNQKTYIPMSLSSMRFWSTMSPERPAEHVDSTNVNEAPPAEGRTYNSDATKQLAAEIEALTKDMKVLKEENAELLNKYKRALADSENLRSRLTKQIADAKIFGIQSFCKDLLEVADTLGHATAAVPQEELTDKNPHLKNLYEGLCMTKASLLQVFKRHGLESMNPINEKFNPNFHEALFEKPDNTVEPNTVVEVTKLGYKLHERCIRPALVGVSKS